MIDEASLDIGETLLSGNAASVEDVAVEKMIPASRVEELVKKAKLKGRDQVQEELESVRAENASLKQNAGSMGGMSAPVNVDEIRKLIMSDLEQKFQESNKARAEKEMNDEAKKIADEYHSKMRTGKDTYEDFDDIMADFDPSAFPNMVFLANKMENTPAVMYELMKNPNKWATIAVLSERDPKAAQKMIASISSSIIANNQAKDNEQDIAPPLNRLSSSITGQDNGKPTLRDFKDKYRG